MRVIVFVKATKDSENGVMPSSEMLLLLVRWPLTFMSAVPRPAVRTSIGSLAVPAESDIRNRKFGEARGKVRSVSAPNGCPVTALEGLINEVEASTLTVSSMRPASRLTSCLAVSPILTQTGATTAFLKLGAVISSL